ncbi:MAG: DUF3794 domain-containing protein [Clostridiales bacterium]|nr:DUF3794 domain-containing protein [Clostridiales bacterium]
MENIYENIRLLQKHKLPEEQITVENNISIDGEVEVKKVLSASAKYDINFPLETLEKECNVGGNIILNVVYVTQDGEINNQTAVSPFNCKISNEQINANSKINARIKVVSTDIDKVLANQIRVITTLNVEGVVVKNLEMPMLKEASGDLYIKQQEQEIVAFEKQNCDKFEENMQAAVKDGVKKILMTNVETTVQNYTAGTNFIQVEGQLYAKVVYVNNQEIAELETITISKNFKQEIEAEGVNRDSIVDVITHVLNEHVQVELEEKENNETIISLNIPIVACYNLYECHKILACQDVYSTENIISVQKDECINFVNLQPEFLEGKLEGNVVLTDEEPRVDKYVATTNVCSIVSNSYVDDGVLYVEGITTANVIYLNDELGGLQSVQIEIPFVLDKKVDLNSDVLLESYVCLYDVDVMVKRGREIYFDAKAKAYVNVSRATNICMVTKTENLEILPVKDSALEIYFAKKGESFWDIAKNLKIPSEIIANQNPNLTDPLEKDENIAIYYQKQRKLEH